MALLNRSSLKNYFKRGSSPTEVNFSDLIDSTINKVDDGFAKTAKDGLILSPKGSSKRLLSMFDNIRDEKPSWVVSINKDKKNKGLSFEQGDNKSPLFLREGGNVGIQTQTPQYPLQVNGMVGMNGRSGTYKQGHVPGDGRWHDILTDLDGIQAFEVMACIKGEVGRGRYAITHAIALSTFGKSSSSIRQTRAYFRWFWNRISLRWVGSLHNFRLQIKTGSHYGQDENEMPRMIQYNIAQLWNTGNAVQSMGMQSMGLNNNVAAEAAPVVMDDEEIDL